MRSHGTLWVAIWFIALLSIISRGNGLSQNELEALTAIKKAWPTLEEQHSSWRAPVADACNANATFYGIKCTDGGDSHVSALNFANCDLISPIPQQLQLLDSLESLDLSYNDFDEFVPEWLASMTSLTHLNLEGNPMEFGYFENKMSLLCNLTLLETLKISGLRYSSPDSCLFGLTHLEELSIGSTLPIEFKIPDSIYSATSLRRLSITNCTKVNSFPFERLTNLTHLHISNIPLLIAPFPRFDSMNLKELVIRDTGYYTATLSSKTPLPESLFSCLNLITLDLSGNLIVSTISPSIRQLQHLEVLDLSGNGIHGKLPFNFGFESFKSLRELRVRGGLLSSSIPSFLWDLPSLQILDLTGNPLEGSIGRGIGDMIDLEELKLGGLFLRGQVPSEIRNLKKLRHLDLHGNGLYYDAMVSYLCYGEPPNPKFNFGLWGSILEDIVELTSLEILQLQGNLFNGSIPSLTHLEHLRYLDIHDNFFNGPIPSNLGSVTSLTHLDLSDNLLEGPIPSSLSSLSLLSYLDLHSNFLNSTIPSTLSQLRKLTYLDISDTHGTLEVHCSGKKTSLQTMAINDMPTFDRHYDIQDYRTYVSSSASTSSRSVERDVVLGSYSGLVGSIPSSFGQLTSLTTLRLANNDLNDTIPESLFGLRNLTTLKLDRNRLTGLAFPSSLASLTNLVNLDLSANQLNGSIAPSVIAALGHLKTLSAHTNKLNGTLPGTLLTLSSLQTLDLHNTNLFGALPEDFTPLKDLQLLNLSNNKLAGVLPKLPPNVEHVSLRYNRIYGPIPSDWATSHMKTIDLPFNQLNGSIPSILFEHTSPDQGLICLPKTGCPPNSACSWLVNKCLMKPDNLWRVLCIAYQALEPAVCHPPLTYLDLSRNHLSGIIPPSLVNMTALHTLSLAYNRNLTGPILDYLQNASDIRVLDLHYNNFEGPFPEHMYQKYRLEHLDLASNFFEGHVDAALGRASSLRVANLSDNNFSGRPLDPDICFALAGDMEILDLHNNDFEGSLPHCSRINSLAVLDISQNQISGSMPREFFKALPSSITTLRFHQNLISGPIPDEFYDLNSLQFVTLSYNQLESSISPRISNLWNLRIFDLRSNKLNGSIPDSFSNLTKLIHVHLGKNELEGTIPAGLRPIGPACVFDVSYNQLHGSVPDLSTLVYCSKFLLDYNGGLTGPLPIMPPRTIHVGLAGNSFSGTLDPLRLSTNRRTPIQAIHLQANDFTGTIPPHVWSLVPKTLDFNVAENRLAGTLSPFGPPLNQLYPFQTLSLSNNWFTGPLPAVSYPSFYDTMDFSRNFFSGQIPPSYRRNLPYLNRLDLSSNEISGDLDNIPTALEELRIAVNKLHFDFATLELPSLKLLDAFNNQIYGTLEWRGIKSMRSLDISDNPLNGTLSPQTFIDFVSHLKLAALGITLDHFPPWTSIPLQFSLLPSAVPLGDRAKCFDLEMNLPNRATPLSVSFEASFLNYLNCVCQEEYYGIAPACYACPSNAVACHNRSVIAPAYHYVHAASGPYSGQDNSWCDRSICSDQCYVDPLDKTSNCKDSTMEIPDLCTDNPSSRCNPGSSGRICARCECPEPANCYYLVGSLCQKCPAGMAGNLLVFVILTSLAVFLMVSFASCTNLRIAHHLPKHLDKLKELLASLPPLTRALVRFRIILPSGLLLILINFLQMLAVIFPDSVARDSQMRILNGQLGATVFVCLYRGEVSLWGLQLAQIAFPFAVALLTWAGVWTGRFILRRTFRLPSDRWSVLGEEPSKTLSSHPLPPRHHREATFVAGEPVQSDSDSDYEYDSESNSESEAIMTLERPYDEETDSMQPPRRHHNGTFLAGESAEPDISNSLPKINITLKRSYNEKNDSTEPSNSDPPDLKEELPDYEEPEESPQQKQEVEFVRILYSWPLAVLRVFYLGTALTAFEYLPTEADPCTGKAWILTRRWLEVDSAFVPRLVGGLLIVYLIGFPLAVFWNSVYWLRKQLSESQKTPAAGYSSSGSRYSQSSPTQEVPEENDYPPSPFILIPHSIFRKPLIWWELCIFFRKFAMALIARFLPFNNALRPASMAILTIVATIAQLAFHPWKSRWANIFEAICQCLLNLSIAATHTGYSHKEKSSTFIKTVLIIDSAVAVLILGATIYRLIQSHHNSEYTHKGPLLEFFAFTGQETDQDSQTRPQ